MDYYEGTSSQVQQPDEHTFLCGYNRVRRYGTTKTLQDTTPQHYFEYLVQQTDTLEGIALRHNCTVSEIVRMNKLWSAQALHLKEIIRIPLKADNENAQNVNQTVARNESNSPATTRQQAESLNDILLRIDQSIKKTSKSVKTIERHSSLHHLDDSPHHNSLNDNLFVSKNRVT